MYGDIDRTEWIQRKVKELELRYGRLEGAELIGMLVHREFQGKIAVSTSFGAESAVLLDLVAQVDPSIPVIFLETRKHFGETLRYRDQLVQQLGLTDVRSIRPDENAIAAQDPDGILWQSDPDACCHLRKTIPLRRALEGFDAWITGRKRSHGGERANLRTIEATPFRVKINPLARWSPDAIAAHFRERNLPAHPLTADGYVSIGCMPCTDRVAPDEHPRAGRWRAFEKTECGIHIPRR